MLEIYKVFGIDGPAMYVYASSPADAVIKFEQEFCKAVDRVLDSHNVVVWSRM